MLLNQQRSLVKLSKARGITNGTEMSLDFLRPQCCLTCLPPLFHLSSS